MSLHNPLFLVRKLISNKLVEAFVGYPAEKSVFLSGFVQGQGQKSEQKHERKKLVTFHNQPTSINYGWLKWMNYDYLIRQAYYSLNHSEGKSLSVQSPPYRLETQIAERHLGQSLEAYTTY